MASSAKTLFTALCPEEKLHEGFRQLRDWPGAEPARRMLDDVYQSFEDPEGNFLQQFQTTGFDARMFELYLFAYFSRSGFEVDRQHVHPDFLVSKGGTTAAVEATTVNPSTSGVLSQVGRRISDLSPPELMEYQQQELPIRFGSPLLSKLKRKYWELSHCRDMPLVLAVEAFHDPDSLGLTDAALGTYLFGLGQTASWDREGTLSVETQEVKAHQVAGKEIPSGFFLQPDTEHVSAVLFTNSGTYPKFSRMGYQHGIGRDEIHMGRWGYCFNPDSDAMDPTFFSYCMDAPPIVEPWGQGLVVFLNPHCLHPLPRDWFPDAVQCYIKNGVFMSDHLAWHPFASKTVIMYMGEVKRKLREVTPPLSSRVAVGAITQQEFQRMCGIPPGPLGEEQGWFSDETNSFLGVVIRDKVDADWGYIVLARDAHFQFRAIDVEWGFASRDEARRELQLKVAEYLASAQRIFAQD